MRERAQEQKAAARTNYYEKIRTRGFPDKATGGSLPQLAAVKTAVVFVDAKNKQRGKEFLAFLLQEDNLQPFVEGSLGRWVPVTKRASVRLQLEVHGRQRRERLGPRDGAHRQGRRAARKGCGRDDRPDQANTCELEVLRTEDPGADK